MHAGAHCRRPVHAGTHHLLKKNPERAQKPVHVQTLEVQLACSDGLYAPPFTSLAFVDGCFFRPVPDQFLTHPPRIPVQHLLDYLKHVPPLIVRHAITIVRLSWFICYSFLGSSIHTLPFYRVASGHVSVYQDHA